MHRFIFVNETPDDYEAYACTRNIQRKQSACRHEKAFGRFTLCAQNACLMAQRRALRLRIKRFLLCLSQRTVARKGKKATAGEWNNFLVSIRINTQSVALYGKERET